MPKSQLSPDQLMVLVAIGDPESGVTAKRLCDKTGWVNAANIAEFLVDLGLVHHDLVRDKYSLTARGWQTFDV